MSGLRTPSRRLSSTTARVTPPSRRKAFSWSFSPRLRTGAEYQQPNRFTAVAEREYEAFLLLKGAPSR